MRSTVHVRVLRLDPNAQEGIKSDRHFSLTADDMQAIRKQFATLVSTKTPHTSERDTTDGVLLYLEACRAGKYAFYTRSTPSQMQPRDAEFVNMANLILGIAHQQRYEVLELEK